MEPFVSRMPSNGSNHYILTRTARKMVLIGAKPSHMEKRTFLARFCLSLGKLGTLTRLHLDFLDSFRLSFWHADSQDTVLICCFNLVGFNLDRKLQCPRK